MTHNPIHVPPITLGKLKYFKKLTLNVPSHSRANLSKAALLSGFKSYHHLSKTLRSIYDLSVEEFISAQ